MSKNPKFPTSPPPLRYSRVIGPGVLSVVFGKILRVSLRRIIVSRFNGLERRGYYVSTESRGRGRGAALHKTYIRAGQSEFPFIEPRIQLNGIQKRAQNVIVKLTAFERCIINEKKKNKIRFYLQPKITGYSWIHGGFDWKPPFRIYTLNPDYTTDEKWFQSESLDKLCFLFCFFIKNIFFFLS